MKFKDFDFRVWNNDSCEYIDSIGLYIFRNLEDNSRCAGIGEAYFNEERIVEINNFDEDLFEIEVWTGFYDNNNKKIYDGDILEDENGEIYKVYFSTIFSIFSLIEINDTYELNDDEMFKILSKTKIIDNIHNIHLIMGRKND